MYKNIIFDLDMTLIETSDSIFNLLDKTCKILPDGITKENLKSALVNEIRKYMTKYQNCQFMRYGIGDLDIFFDTGFERHVGKKEADIARKYIVKKTLEKLRVRDLNKVDEVIDFLMKNWLNFNLIDNVEEMLNKMKGYRVFLLTDGMTETQLSRAFSLKLDKYFEKMYASEYFGMSKKYCIPFETLLRENGLKADETLMIGDNYVSDILGSKNAGITPIYFNRNGDYMDGVVNVKSVKELMDFLKI